MSSTSQTFFSEVCSLTTRTATSVASLMRTAGFGFEKDSDNNITTQPSLDTFDGAQLIIIPATATVWLGHDQYVSSGAVAGPPRTYLGVPIASGALWCNLAQATRGIVDPENVWLYSNVTQNIYIVFVGI